MKAIWKDKILAESLLRTVTLIRPARGKGKQVTITLM
jgi:hypothetical protein